MKDNFGFKHKAGIFMAVSSLPSNYGIGGFGKESFDFIDFLVKTGQKVWQVLPLNPTAYGDSPYQSPSVMAGNPYFIDPFTLYKKGLLTRAELNENVHLCSRVDYGWLFETRFKMLEKAFSKFTKTRLYARYCTKNKYWLDDYCLYMALKLKHNYAPWTAWEEEFKNYETAVTFSDKLKREMDFFRFIQFEFSEEWKAVTDYAHKNGIKILGDMPIYVAYDSVDVWANKKGFLLDENFNPTIVAGCPPDGFSPDGQLWGNPIYNWEEMQANGFDWWVKRVKRSRDLYDILRIDHFRGFAGYYAIPYGHPAKDGKWVKGIGYPLFEKIQAAVPNLRVIAEDLGVRSQDVVDLLQKTGYPGMKMLQFAFYDGDKDFLPKNYTTDNCVVYCGTHDSDATAGWVKNMSPQLKKRFYEEVPVEKGQRLSDALILFGHKSRANLSMVPIIDYMRLDNSARMNTPATGFGNWTFRVNKNYRTKALEKRILTFAKAGGREYFKNSGNN